MTGQPGPDPSPLGRHAPDPTGARLARVALLGLPVPLLLASREHHDGLMREFRLLALAGQIAETDAPRRLVELVAILGQQYGSSRDRRDEEIDAALLRGDATVDQVMEVPETATAAIHALQALVDEADEYCRQAMLVTLPRPDVVRRFSDWYFGEIAGQIAGAPPHRWDGPLQP